LQFEFNQPKNFMSNIMLI